MTSIYLSIDYCNLCMYSTVGESERYAEDQNCGSNQTIGIAVLSVLLVIAIVCIIGLVIWIVKLNKKLAQTKSKEM